MASHLRPLVGTDSVPEGHGRRRRARCIAGLQANKEATHWSRRWRGVNGSGDAQFATGGAGCAAE
jgi:hypothetical protein